MAQNPVEELHRLVQKSMAIELLENHIATLEQRITDLVIHNNQLLERARRAEAELDKKVNQC